MIFVALLALIFQIIAGLIMPMQSGDGMTSVLRVDVQEQSGRLNETTVQFPSSQAEFGVEIADTPAGRAKGLMFRTKMSEHHGMIFVFDDEKPRTFWMKNTMISLDMIFADNDGNIVKVLADVPPCREGAKSLAACPLYPSEKAAKYVVELNAGVAQEYHIQEGEKMVMIGN